MTSFKFQTSSFKNRVFTPHLLVRKGAGFTLIEILVVLIIIVILTAVAFSNYKTGQRQLALQRAAGKLAQDIRRAQEMAMGAEECVLCPGGGVPSGGYGIYIDKFVKDRYYIYADISDPKYRYGSGDQIIEIIYLEEGITIYDLVPPSANFSINFRPPDPIVDIRDAAGQDKENVTIIVSLETDSTKTKTIKVNEVGRIDIE